MSKDSGKRKTFDKLQDPEEIVEKEEAMEVQTFIKAFQELLEDSDGNDFSSDSPLTSEMSVDAKEIQAEPGFCIKTIDSDGRKVFLNVCHCHEISCPPEIKEDELRSILMSEEESAYRVPMSLGSAHYETDKSGKECVAYDIVVNTKFFKKTETSDFFKYFFVNIAIEGVEIKYSIKLNREMAKCLKNKHYHGKMQKHFIRSQPKPLITELDNKHSSSLTESNSSQKQQETPLLQAAETKYTKKPLDQSLTGPKKPNFVIKKEPAHFEKPTKMIVTFNLDGHADSTYLNVDIGEDRLILEDTKGIYAKTDFYLPFNVEQDKCHAEFDRRNKVLTLSLLCSY